MNAKATLTFAAEELAYRLACGRYWLQGGRRRPLGKVLVNGTPKTGTTWMAKLVHSVPGYWPAGNFGKDVQQYRNVTPGAVIHGHDRYSPALADILTTQQIKVVLMLRDPRDQTVSRMFHIRRDAAHHWHEQMADLDVAEGLMACIEGRPGLASVDTLFGISRSWLEAGFALHCTRYEDLISAPVAQFLAVLRYLDIPGGEGLARAVVRRNRFQRLTVGRKFWQDGRRPGQESAASHFRKGIAGDWRNHFTDAHGRRFKEVAGDLLVELGYERDLDW